MVIVACVSLGSALCPMYQCVDLEENICARQVNSTHFQINQLGCTSKHVCSAVYLSMWARFNSTAMTTHQCLADPRDRGMPRTPDASFPCETKRQGKNFASGQTVIPCSSDTDCLLVDGTHSQCRCAFRNDGKGLCQPDMSNDSVFSDYWSVCSTNGALTNYERAMYWWMYREVFVFTHSDLPCSSIFMEMETIKQVTP